MRIQALLVAALIALAPSAAQARSKRSKKKVTYHYEVWKVSVKVKGAPAHVSKLVRDVFVAEVNKHKRLLSSLPGAPDPKADPKGYKKYLAAKKLRSYKVNIEVLEFENITEPSPKKGLRYGARVRLRAFGETIPMRIMAFQGEGSATVKFDVGTKVRKRDMEYADRAAVEVAIQKALARAIAKLDASAKNKKKKRRRRRR